MALGRGWAGSAKQHPGVGTCRVPRHKSHHVSPNTCSGLNFELLRQNEKCKSKSYGPPGDPVHGRGRVPYIHEHGLNQKQGPGHLPALAHATRQDPDVGRERKYVSEASCLPPTAGLRWFLGQRQGWEMNSCSAGPAQNAEGLRAMAKIAIICPKSAASLIVWASLAHL